MGLITENRRGRHERKNSREDVEMAVMIHNKAYKTVAERVNEIHQAEKGKKLSVETELIRFDAGIAVVQATVTTEQGVFQGLAYESADSSQINKTSSLENCETSAIGRALAAAGYAGSEYASANEVQNAVHQQGPTAPVHNGSGLDFDRDFLMPFGKHKGVKFRDIEIDYLAWLRDKSTSDEMRDFATKEIEARKSEGGEEPLPF